MDNVLFPTNMYDDMHNIISALMTYSIPPQQIITFESSTKAYLAVCQANFAVEVITTAQLKGSDNAFILVKQLAPNQDMADEFDDDDENEDWIDIVGS